MRPCASLNSSIVVVVDVDYRVLREHKFPVAVDDAIMPTVGCWSMQRNTGGDPGRIILNGRMQGLILAALITLKAKKEGKLQPINFGDS